jgi:hypothetical protein
MNIRLRRLRNRFTAIPTRFLMGLLSGQRPRKDFDGIALIASDPSLTLKAGLFFERSTSALMRAQTGAPVAFGEFRQDVREVLLWGQSKAPSYQRFQLAVVVPPRIALEADLNCYAAWLLYTSGLIYGRDEARARSNDFAHSLNSRERTTVAEWFVDETERGQYS